MKKLFVLMLALMPVLFLVSCNKPEKGTKVLSKTYIEKNGEAILVGDYHWNGKTLQSIDFYQGGEIYYTVEYEYDGSKLSKMAYKEELEDGTIDETDYVFYYNGDKIEKIVNTYMDEPVVTTYYTYDGEDVICQGINVELAYKGGYKALPRHAMNPAYAKVYEMIAEGKMSKAPKAADDYDMAITMDYKNHNAENMIMLQLGEEVMRYEFTYDNAHNPFKGIYEANFYQWTEIFSTNNFNHIVCTMYGVEDVYQVTLDYDEDNYPIRYNENGNYIRLYEYTVVK